MSDAVSNFFNQWAETDAAAQKAAIAGLLADGFTYSDPRSGARLEGADATADYVAMFAANAPGWSASVEKLDEVNGYFRASVAFGGMGPDGSEMKQMGSYFGELTDDGKIAFLAGFAG